MNDDTISRQAAIDALCKRCDLAADDDEPCTEKCNDIRILEKLPSAQPERKRGKWIVYKAPDKQHCGLIKCPFCGEDMIAEADEYNFCPNCGAQMER